MGSVRNKPTAMGMSVALHALGVLALLLVPPPRLELPPVPPPAVRVALTQPADLPPPPAPRRPRRQTARLELPTQVPQAPPERQAPVLDAPRLEAEAAPNLALPQERFEVDAPAPPPRTVKMAGFEGAALQAPGPAREARLQVGGFHGMSGAPGGAPKAQVRQGAFASSQATRADGKAAPAVGAGGFGSAAVTQSSGPRVATGAAGFATARAEKVQRDAEPVRAEARATPIQILSKPKPVYTAEARQARIEGEVVLEARFGSDGAVTVLRVVRGLGYGLDEAAAAALRAMRFEPAKRGGVPVDSTLSVSVAFQLAY
ncbi:MAG: energy transducer TonB [Bryobacterales bacterium]|nr:energy transducer TonB [Bryobacterales bacterium]